MGYWGDNENIYITTDLFVEDVLSFVHPWRYDEARRTLDFWLESCDGAAFVLTSEHRAQIGDWEQKDRAETSRYIPVKIRRTIHERDKGRCRVCDSTENLSFDHVKPFSRGGRHTRSNLQLLCMPCNRSKGVRGGRFGELK